MLSLYLKFYKWVLISHDKKKVRSDPMVNGLIVGFLGTCAVVGGGAALAGVTIAAGTSAAIAGIGSIVGVL
jgi:hypothetical protein